MMNRAVTRAMATQLDRVNGRSDRGDAVPTLADWRASTAAPVPPRPWQMVPTGRRWQVLAADGTLIIDGFNLSQKDLWAWIVTTINAAADHHPTGQMYNNRPVLTATEAAQRASVSIATVNRYCQSGHWQAVQYDNLHWFIYADQSLTKKTRRNKKG